MKQLLVFILSAFAAFFLFFYFFQRSLIYFPTKEVLDLNQYSANDMQIVLLKTEDGLLLKSWYKPSINKQPTLLFLHGNAGHIGHRIRLVRPFIDKGWGVFLLEYRGYGKNPGTPTEHGLYKDAYSAIDYLNQHQVKSHQILLYGESLGTAVATKLASDNLYCAMILSSPFTSMDSLAKLHYPWMLVKPWDHFDSLARIKASKTPLLILHGKRDEIVPYTHALSLYQTANPPKKLVLFKQKSHNDVWRSENYYKIIFQFEEKYCK